MFELQELRPWAHALAQDRDNGFHAFLNSGFAQFLLQLVTLRLKASRLALQVLCVRKVWKALQIEADPPYHERPPRLIIGQFLHPLIGTSHGFHLPAVPGERSLDALQFVLEPGDGPLKVRRSSHHRVQTRRDASQGRRDHIHTRTLLRHHAVPARKADRPRSDSPLRRSLSR